LHLVSESLKLCQNITVCN